MPRDDDSTEDEEEEHDSSQSGSDDAEVPPDVQLGEQDHAELEAGAPAKKKRAPPVPREFTEVNRWIIEDFGQEGVHKLVLDQLAALEADGGGFDGLVRHSDRSDQYGGWTSRRKWATNQGFTTNTVLGCPFSRDTGCKCEVKIVQTPAQIVMFVCNLHSREDHSAERSKRKYLKAKDRCLIKTLVQVAPHSNASDLLRNVQNSPTKKIDHRLKKSIARQIRKERKSVNTVILGGVELDTTLGALSRVTDAVWLGTAVSKHQSGTKCIELHQVYVIGRQFDAADRMVMISVATPFSLMNIFRAVGTGYSVMIQGDVTGKASSSALNKLRFGFTRLGGHTVPWTDTLIPADTESEQAYTQAFKVANMAVRALVNLPNCQKASCEFCECIADLLRNGTIRACVEGRPYMQLNELPISKALGDNHTGWQNFVRKVLGIDPNVCNTHATAIGKQNGSQRTHFHDPNTYEKWYVYVCRIKDVSFEEPGFHMQVLLCDWLRLQGEDEAADWQTEYWMGPRGRWMAGNGGIAMQENQQGLESNWRWDRQSISGGRQVI